MTALELSYDLQYNQSQRWFVMPGLQPKKRLILNILEILKRHTNPENSITKKRIVEYLEQRAEKGNIRGETRKCQRLKSMLIR